MKIKVRYDPHKNIQNIRRVLDFSKKDNYGFRDVSERINRELAVLYGNNKKNYLNDLGKLERDLEGNSELNEKLKESAEKLQIALTPKKIKEYCNTLEKIYQTSVPDWDIKVYMNIVPISSYNFENKWMMIYYKNSLSHQIHSVLHELNHFVFHELYYDLKDTLGYSKFHEIKESLAVLTNPKEKGYPNHHEARRFIQENFQKSVPVSEIINKLSKK